MDIAVSLPIVANPSGDMPSGVVLGLPGLERLLLEISVGKQYVYKMPKPPVMYVPTPVRQI